MAFVQRDQVGNIIGIYPIKQDGYAEEFIENPKLLREPTSNRDKRQTDYIAELSPEGTFEKTVGDMIDAIVDHISGKPGKLNVLKAKIDAIKLRHP